MLPPVRHLLFLPSDLSPALMIPSQEPISSVSFSKMSTDFVLIGQVPFYLRLILGMHELLTPHDFEHAKQKISLSEILSASYFHYRVWVLTSFHFLTSKI